MLKVIQSINNCMTYVVKYNLTINYIVLVKLGTSHHLIFEPPNKNPKSTLIIWKLFSIPLRIICNSHILLLPLSSMFCIHVFFLPNFINDSQQLRGEERRERAINLAKKIINVGQSYSKVTSKFILS